MTGIFGETLPFKQENGPDVQLVVFGDEHYARYETEDGYTVVYDKDRGLFCYATLIDGSFVSSGVPISEPPPGTPPHLKDWSLPASLAISLCLAVVSHTERTSHECNLWRDINLQTSERS
jgi:hypothetical protein